MLKSAKADMLGMFHLSRPMAGNSNYNGDHTIHNPILATFGSF